MAQNLPLRGVRIARVEDARAIAAIYAPYVAGSALSFELDPPDETQIARRIEATLEKFPWLAFEEEGEVLGYAYAGAHRERAAYRWSVDTAIYVAPRAQRRGVGKSLYALLLDVLRLQGFGSAFAGIALPNGASVALHEAMGFRPIGVYREVGFKLGAWHDVGWWGVRLNPPRRDPGPPESFAAGIFERAQAACAIPAAARSRSGAAPAR